MAALRGLRRMLCVLPLMALAACGGVGKGDKVEYLQMIDASSDPATALQPGADVQAYQCIRKQLGVLAVFGKNGSGNYTTRPATIWTSSNPGVVRVSNDDELDTTQPGRYYPKGVITPVSPGTAVITADYAGITTNVEVTVRAPDSIILSTSSFDFGQDATAAGTLSIATRSTQQYYAYARLRDQNNVVTVQGVTGSAVWSIPDDPNAGVASMTTHAPGTNTGGGLVTGRAQGGPVTINANFSACPGTVYENIQAKVQVSDVQSLSLEHDPNFLAIANPPHPLILNTGEALVVKALLNNSQHQDLSQQATLLTDTSGAAVVSVGAGSNIVTASTVGSANVQASFLDSGGNPIYSPTLAIQTQDATLNTFTISPGILGGTPTPGAPNDRDQNIPLQGFYPFHSLGIFASAVDGSTIIQDLTHSTIWVSGSPVDVEIGNAADVVGIASSLRSVQTCVTIYGAPKFVGGYIDSTHLGVGIPYSVGACP